MAGSWSVGWKEAEQWNWLYQECLCNPIATKSGRASLIRGLYISYTGTLTPHISLVQIREAPSKNVLTMHTSTWLTGASILCLHSVHSLIIQIFLSSSSVLPGNCSGDPLRTRPPWFLPSWSRHSGDVVLCASNVLMGGWRGAWWALVWGSQTRLPNWHPLLWAFFQHHSKGSVLQTDLVK